MSNTGGATIFSSGGTGPIPDLATLTSATIPIPVPVATLVEGHTLWVVGEKEYYRLEKSSGATISSPNVVQAQGGPAAARWIRLNTGGVPTRASVPLGNPGVVKVHGLGASIYEGSGGSPSVNGYRGHIWDSLRLGRGDISFVGTLRTSTSTIGKYSPGEWEHDGHPGAKVSDFLPSGAIDINTLIAAVGVADVYLWGSDPMVNSAAANVSGATAAAQLATIINAIFALAPMAKILVLACTPNNATPADQAKIAAYNAIILAAGWANQFGTYSGSVFVEDPTTGLTIADQANDKIHLNDTGNARVGQAAASFLEQLVLPDPPTGRPFPRPQRLRPSQSSILLGGATSIASAVKASTQPGANSFWVWCRYRPSALPATNNVIVAYGDALVDGYILAQSNDGVTVFTAGNNLITAASMPGSLFIGQQHEIFALWDATNLINAIWIDGMLRGVVDASGGLTAWNFPAGKTTRIGNWAGIAGPALGLVDQYGIGIGAGVPTYKNARWHAEAAWAEGRIPDGCVALFQCDDGAGATAADKFGGTSLALAGGAAFTTQPRTYDFPNAQPRLTAAGDFVRVARRLNVLTYGATVTPDASKGDLWVVTILDGNPWTLAAPTNPTIGQVVQLTLLNASGGAGGAVTPNAVYRFAGAIAVPANTKERIYTLEFDGTSWVESARSAADA